MWRHVHGEYHGLRHRGLGDVVAVQLIDSGEDPAKIAECLAAGPAIYRLLEKDLKPCDIMTREAFENAIVLIMTLGGSTNAVLHLIAMARAVGVPLTIDDFQRVSDRVPLSGGSQAEWQVRPGRLACRGGHARGHEVSPSRGTTDR